MAVVKGPVYTVTATCLFCGGKELQMHHYKDAYECTVCKALYTISTFFTSKKQYLVPPMTRERATALNDGVWPLPNSIAL